MGKKNLKLKEPLELEKMVIRAVKDGDSDEIYTYIDLLHRTLQKYQLAFESILHTIESKNENITLT